MALIDCPNCGNKISEYATICNKCAHSLTNKNTVVKNQENETSVIKKTSNGSTFLIILLILIISGVAYYFYHINTSEYKLNEEKRKWGLH